MGIGVSGREGMQAVRAADYAIGQFAHLRRLLLVHGFWNYQRVSFVVLYTVYKQGLFVFSLFFFITIVIVIPTTRKTSIFKRTKSCF